MATTSSDTNPAPANDRELVISRLLNAPRTSVYRCWSEPELLKQWFCPKPWIVTRADIDVRSGGSSMIIMRGPEGQEVPNPGVYLEVIPGEKIVFTDAFTSAWMPKEGAPFMIGEITFADEGTKTRYLAKVRHWTTEATEQHREMGFYEGWGAAADQLEALAKTL